MATSKKVLFLLLALVLILPASFVVAPAALAEDEQPGQGAEGVPVPYGPPDLIGYHNGIYVGKASCTVIYDNGRKEKWSGDIQVTVYQQVGYAVWVSWPWYWWMTCPEGHEARSSSREPSDKASGENGPSGWPVPGDNPNGWVGVMYVDSTSGKPVNQPPLRAAYFTEWLPSEGFYDTRNLTATVKLDKYRNVKSIKGTISEVWSPVYHANWKFTVKPYYGPLGKNGLPPGFELPPGMKLPQQPK